MSIKLVNLSSTHYIILSVPVAKHMATFLVDSQADVSIIRRSSLKSTAPINIEEIINISGVTKGVVRSEGSINTLICVDIRNVEHNFVVVPSDFPIPTDGILGKDFIQTYSCIIDYQTMLFRINLSTDQGFDIPIHVEDHTGDTIYIPTDVRFSSLLNLRITVWKIR